MSEREREEGVCFCKHWKCGERDAEGVCGALPVLEVYIYIYTYTYVYINLQRLSTCSGKISFEVVEVVEVNSRLCVELC